MRLDLYLVEKKFTDSRTRAKNLIEMGNVKVNNINISKPAYDVKPNDIIEIVKDYNASLGSLKLEKALLDFNLDLNNKVCLDLGAANGGFTEILLKNGAKKIYALDIGNCALPDYLINNSKIVVKDKTNARYIKKTDFPDDIDFCTIDLSFISLKLILPAVFDILNKNGYVIALIKPQFELNKKNLPKSGIVRDEKLRKTIINSITTFAENLGFKFLNITSAPHPFEYKNQEYLIFLSK